MSHPMQPLVVDDSGVVRFKANLLVRYLLDAGPFNLNDLALLHGIPAEDWEQLAQLIGYSVSGFGELSYVDPSTVAKADRLAVALHNSPR